jgi:hypothetical protein
MIHYRPEGKFYKIGLNITCGRNGWLPWIAFAWIWYNVEKHELFKWYLRLRTWNAAYIYSCYRQDVVANYMIQKGLTAVSDEFVKDLQYYQNERNGFNKFLKKHDLFLED